MSIGENIKKVRKEKGLTQKELGDRLGVKQATISMFEKDQTNIKLTTVIKIANALGVDVDTLLVGSPFGVVDRNGKKVIDVHTSIIEELETLEKEADNFQFENQIEFVLKGLLSCKYTFGEVTDDKLPICEVDTGKKYTLNIDDFTRLRNTTLDYFNFTLKQILSAKKEDK